MATTAVRRRRQVVSTLLALALAPIFVVCALNAASATEDHASFAATHGVSAVEPAGHGTVDTGGGQGSGLAEGGSESNQLLILGLGLLLSGGIAAYAVSRGRGVGHGR